MAGIVIAVRHGLRKLVAVLIVSGVTLAAAVFGGPVVSGAIFLLLPAPLPAVEHGLPKGHEPLHKGAVDFATGLYFREDDDLVVDGTPPLTLRRTYLSAYRASKQFGIGATHNGEIALHGNLQQISLILARGSRVTFDRTSAGGSYVNAMFEHRSRGEWAGARLGWAGLGWALRRRDGDLMLFQGCGGPTVCSIIQWRDADGHTTRYRRDGSGRLSRMEAGDRWISVEYDNRDRIVLARASTGQAATYEYDAAGRLSRAVGDAGREHRYTYTDKDEMEAISDPGRAIANTYDANGRCVRQIVRYSDDAEPLTFTFSYRLQGNAVVQTDVARSDGEWSQYTFSLSGTVLTERWGGPDVGPTQIAYERDPETERATALSVTCPDRKGILLPHGSLVRDGDEERVRMNVLTTHCSWRSRQ